MKIKSGMEQEYATYKAVNSADDYSKGVVDYAERWASAMEDVIYSLRMISAADVSISSCAKHLGHECDTEGITGFMYGCAVSALSKFWEHGEELRQWSNLDIQIGDEGEKANESGGVLNPALMSIG